MTHPKALTLFGGTVRFEPAGGGTKRTVPKASPVLTMSKTASGHALSSLPSPVADRANTPGSAPAVAQSPLPEVCWHDGTTAMPGSGWGHGNASPASQTVFVAPSSGKLLVFSSEIEAGKPVWPTVA